MKNATPDSDRKYASYLKKMGIRNPVTLLNCARDINIEKRSTRQQKQYKPTGFGVTRYNKHK